MFNIQTHMVSLASSDSLDVHSRSAHCFRTSRAKLGLKKSPDPSSLCSDLSVSFSVLSSSSSLRRSTSLQLASPWHLSSRSLPTRSTARSHWTGKSRGTTELKARATRNQNRNKLEDLCVLHNILIWINSILYFIEILFSFHLRKGKLRCTVG